MTEPIDRMDTLLVAPIGKRVDDTQAVPQAAGRAETTRPWSMVGLLSRIGRFTVIETLGEGGMGIVYGAYDELLDRKVAVKLLRSDSLQDDPQARDRMLREAKAMARLTHANIARVYEVGSHGQQIYIAMEFVRGRHLGEWANAERRGWRLCVETLLEAGRGLAAAHAAGLIHRDFKPANVLIGGEGEVKVVDFGLALAVDDGEPDTTAAASLSGAPLGDLTRTGTLLGTPAYMGPEQFLGVAASPASDQFSFCVTLYELVYGQSPFDRSSLTALLAAHERGKIADPPAGTAAPAGLWPIVQRGLAMDPALRWPSMPALLTELERVLAPRVRWRVALPAAMAVVLAVAGAIGAAMPARDVCAATSSELVGVWDANTEAAAMAGVRATNVSFADETWDRVRPRLDAYAQALAGMRAGACRSHATGELAPELFDRQTACLDQRRASLTAFVAILQHATPEVVGNAAAALAGLPAVSTCGDLEALGAALPLPDDPAVAVAVQRARETLAEAHAYELAGQFKRGLELLADIPITELSHPPLQVEFGLRRGSLLSENGQHEEADKTLAEALRGALVAGHHLAAAAIATRREFILAARLQRSRDVLRDAPLVEGIVQRVAGSEAGAPYVGDHLNNLGIAHAILGEGMQAQQLFEASVAARRAALGDNHPEVVYALANLGLLAVERGDLRQAVERLGTAMTAAEATLGATHPHNALVAVNLGYAHQKRGQLRAANTVLQRALELQTELLGPEAPDLHYTRAALGELAVEERRCDAAREQFVAALKLLGQVDRREDPAMINAVLGVGNAATCRRDFAAARLSLERALRMAEKSHGVDEPRVADVLISLGTMQLAAGELEQALISYRRVESIRVAKLPPTSRMRGEAHRHVGETLRRLGRFDEAAVAFEQARLTYLAGEAVEDYFEADLYDRLGALALDRGDAVAAGRDFTRAVALFAAIGDDDRVDLALARLGLSRALVAQAGGWIPEARALAEQAAAALRGRGQSFAVEAAQAEAWLAKGR